MPVNTCASTGNGRTTCSSRSCARIGTTAILTGCPQPQDPDLIGPRWARRLRVPGLTRQHGQIDAELGECPLPLPVVIGSEHDLVICGDRKPAIGLNLGVELTGCPAGIAQGEEALARPPILADCAQHLERSRYRNIAADMESGLLAIVGRVEHKA